MMVIIHREVPYTPEFKNRTKPFAKWKHSRDNQLFSKIQWVSILEGSAITNENEKYCLPYQQTKDAEAIKPPAFTSYP